MQEIFDYYFYCENFFKIKTKSQGLQPFLLREYQKRFIQFWEEIEGPTRIIALKPRQAGFSTLVTSKLCHRYLTREFDTGIVMADKQKRTQSLHRMHHTFLENVPEGLLPRFEKNNTEELFFKHTKSGVSFETGHDPNAGRAEGRRWAHLSEWAFIRYTKEIDDGVQNSIPLDPDTAIIKESTANGRGGIGKAFYDLWNAAKRGDSIYKPFFVAWYEVDDYAITPPDDFKLTKNEKELMKKAPKITEANLYWRRLKVKEYLDDDEVSILTPDERFKQDFPSDDVEAFLSTGAPVYDAEILTPRINELRLLKPNDIKERLSISDYLLRAHWNSLTIFTPPRQGRQYFIGADVSEGLAQGDASSAYICDESGTQVASFHGKIDSDLFGHILVTLGEFYNKALLVIEKNNMGLSTVQTVRNTGYIKIFKERVEDKVTKKVTESLGWRTTVKSKMLMISDSIKAIRDGVRILDVRLLEEMASLAREENGNVNLNSKDRTVAFCLAMQGRKDFNKPITLKPINPHTGEGAHKLWKKSQSSQDIF